MLSKGARLITGTIYHFPPFPPRRLFSLGVMPPTCKLRNIWSLPHICFISKRPLDQIPKHALHNEFSSASIHGTVARTANCRPHAQSASLLGVRVCLNRSITNQTHYTFHFPSPWSLAHRRGDSSTTMIRDLSLPKSGVSWHTVQVSILTTQAEKFYFAYTNLD